MRTTHRRLELALSVSSPPGWKHGLGRNTPDSALGFTRESAPLPCKSLAINELSVDPRTSAQYFLPWAMSVATLGKNWYNNRVTHVSLTARSDRTHIHKFGFIWRAGWTVQSSNNFFLFSSTYADHSNEPSSWKFPVWQSNEHDFFDKEMSVSRATCFDFGTIAHVFGASAWLFCAASCRLSIVTTLATGRPLLRSSSIDEALSLESLRFWMSLQFGKEFVHALIQTAACGSRVLGYQYERCSNSMLVQHMCSV